MMKVSHRTVGEQTGHFVHYGDDAHVFYGPFAGEKEANDFLEKLEAPKKKTL